MATNQRGFTLIELLLVIGILAILAGVLVTAINPLAQFEKTRDAQRKSDLAQIKRALLMMYNDLGIYPPTDIWDKGDLIEIGEMVYMRAAPQDPLWDPDTKEPAYQYVQLNEGLSFCVWATLERTDDEAIEESQNRCSDCDASVGIEEDDYVVCPD